MFYYRNHIKAFILAMTIGLLFAAPSVYAAPPDPVPPPSSNPGSLGKNYYDANGWHYAGCATLTGGSGYEGQCSNGWILIQGDGPGRAAAQANNADASNLSGGHGIYANGTGGNVCAASLSWSDWLQILWCAVSFIVLIVYWFVSAFMYVAATLFDHVIDLLVVHMGVFIQSPVIRTSWIIIRNLLNISIIAGLVAVGISTILQVGYKAETWLSKLIIAALLINFSFFFAGALIDASNFLASTLYETQIVSVLCNPTAVGGGTAGCAGTNQAKTSEIILSFMKLSQLENLSILAKGTTLSTGTSGSVGQSNQDASPVQKYILLGIVGIVLMVFMTTIFFITSFLLISRFVTLVLLLVASPVGIAGYNIPYIDTYAKKWWSNITSQLIFAPAYLLLLAISLNVAKALPFNQVLGNTIATGLEGLASADANKANDAVQLILGSLVVLVFMYLSLTVAKTTSKQAGDFKEIYDYVGRFGAGSVGRVSSWLGGVPYLNRLSGGTLDRLAKDDFGGGESFAGRRSGKVNTPEDLRQWLINRDRNASTTPKKTEGVATPQKNGGGASTLVSQPSINKPKGAIVVQNGKILKPIGPDEERMTRFERNRREVADAGSKALGAVRTGISNLIPKPKPTEEELRSASLNKLAEEQRQRENPSTPSQSPTIPPTKTPEGTVTVAAGGSLPLTQNIPATQTTQDRINDALQRHNDAQIQSHNETIVKAAEGAGMGEAVRELAALHAEHQQAMRLEREKTASEQVHAQAADRARELASRIEKEETRMLDRIADEISATNGRLATLNSQGRSGGTVEPTVKLQLVETQQKLDALNMHKTAITEARTQRSKLVTQTPPNTKV